MVATCCTANCRSSAIIYWEYSSLWRLICYNWAVHCTMLPLSIKSCLKSSNFRPILNGQFIIICSCSNYLKYMEKFYYRSILVDSWSIVHCRHCNLIKQPRLFKVYIHLQIQLHHQTIRAWFCLWGKAAWTVGHALSRQAEPPFVEQEAHLTAHSPTLSAGGWNAEVFHRQPPKSWK